MFSFPKDTIFTLKKSSIIYCLICPGCSANCVGKAAHNLVAHLHKHGSSEDQLMHQHILKCSHFMNTKNLMRLPDISRSTSGVLPLTAFRSILHQDVSVLDS